MSNAKPFLRWAGSKKKQISRLSLFWHPNYTRYVEPFAGSCSLFFALSPQEAILGDKNAELIDMYSTVRDHSEDIYDRVAAIPRTRDTYYKMRSQCPENLLQVERAVRFIYLNRNCFNGIFRTNARGQFNVPFASSRVGAFVTRDEFVKAAELLRCAQLCAADFGSTLRYVRRGDFVYLDPPYVVKSRRVFREYGAKVFDNADIDRLQRHLRAIDVKGAHFVVSYADCREARCLAQDWTCHRIRLRRHIAGFSEARRLAYELLITNIDLAERTEDDRAPIGLRQVHRGE
jgi:DNA adenine methylase